MKTTVIAAALLAATTLSASADYSSSTTCGRTYLGKYECHSNFRRAPVASGPVELRTTDEIEKFNAEWDYYCRPQRAAPDQYGVVRMIYAHPGCEFGATGGTEGR